jgi:glucose-1-phosphate adenylyltransferase
MDLLEMHSSLLFKADWPIRTREESKPPAVVTETGEVIRSLVPCGCIIEGRVEHSVLSPGVRVAEGAVVKDSIILSDTVIGPHSVVNYSILDKEVVVEAGCHIGCGDNFQINRREPGVVNTGITIVGKRAMIPAGVRLGRNCIVDCGVVEDDFPGSEVQSGETVRPKKRHPARKV